MVVGRSVPIAVINGTILIIWLCIIDYVCLVHPALEAKKLERKT